MDSIYFIVEIPDRDPTRLSVYPLSIETLPRDIYSNIPIAGEVAPPYKIKTTPVAVKVKKQQPRQRKQPCPKKRTTSQQQRPSKKTSSSTSSSLRKTKTNKKVVVSKKNTGRGISGQKATVRKQSTEKNKKVRRLVPSIPLPGGGYYYKEEEAKGFPLSPILPSLSSTPSPQREQVLSALQPAAASPTSSSVLPQLFEGEGEWI